MRIAYMKVVPLRTYKEEKDIEKQASWFILFAAMPSGLDVHIIAPRLLISFGNKSCVCAHC